MKAWKKIWKLLVRNTQLQYDLDYYDDMWDKGDEEAHNAIAERKKLKREREWAKDLCPRITEVECCTEDLGELFLIAVKVALHNFHTRAQQSFECTNIQAWGKEKRRKNISLAYISTKKSNTRH